MFQMRIRQVERPAISSCLLRFCEIYVSIAADGFGIVRSSCIRHGGGGWLVDILFKPIEGSLKG